MAVSIDTIDFIVDVDVSAYGPPNFSDYGLHDGHFRWCYGDSFTPPGGAAKGGILSGMDSIETAVDISETGGFFTDSSFSCSIQNSLNFENLIAAYGVRFVGLPLVVSFFDGTTETTIWTGRVSAWSTGETEINISASVDALVPSGDLQNSVIDAERFPGADADVFGASVPVVFGDVEYSPTVLLNKDGRFLAGPFYLNVDNDYWTGTVPPGHFCIKTQTMTLTQMAEISVATNPAIVFVNGDAAPTRTYRIVGEQFIWPYSVWMIAGTLDATGHNWDGAANSNTSPWFYDIVDVESASKASEYAQYGFGPYAEKDSMSFYDSVMKQYTRSIGIVKDVSTTGDVSYYAKPRSDYTENPLTFTAQPFDKIGMNNGFLFSWRKAPATTGPFATIDPPTAGAYSDIYDRDQSTSADFSFAYSADIFGWPVDVMMTAYGLDSSLFKKGSRAFVCVDFHSLSGNYVVGRYLNIVARHNGVEVGVVQTLYEYEPAINMPMQNIPREFYAGAYSGYDNFEKIINGDSGFTYYEIPQYLIDGINDGLYTEIDLHITYRAYCTETYNGSTYDYADTYHVNGISIVSSIGEIERGATPYISTEGETVGDDGTTKTNSMQNAVLHIVEDYAGSSATVPSTGAGALHVGRTITEPIKVQDCLDSLLKQAFAVGYIGKTGVITVKGWLDSIGSSPVVAFNEDNIIRNSISQWTTTPTNRVYNSFSCAYDYDYETDKYRSSMAINNPAGTFPAITGAWDKFVSGIGSGSDATAYAEAAEAWEYCRAGFSESGALRAYSKSNGELSWFTDPSWLGTPVAKTDLSAWYFIKTCAYWLSTPRREAKFRVSLEYIGLNILDYCTFKDYIVTNDEVYSGWITSLSIDREGITVGMSMDRKIAMDESIRERGIQTIEDVRYRERGVQVTEDNSILETGR
jgi:hypothetical protein